MIALDAKENDPVTFCTDNISSELVLRASTLKVCLSTSSLNVLEEVKTSATKGFSNRLWVLVFIHTMRKEMCYLYQLYSCSTDTFCPWDPTRLLLWRVTCLSSCLQVLSAYTATATTLSVVSGRVAYTFGLQGPTLSVDTACSSSLVATHAAFNALNLQQCQAAVAAGVNLALVPDTPAMFTRAGMLSPEGRCKTLDAAADGYVRAEAIGAFMLQLCAQPSAAAAGGVSNTVMAVICGSAVNQDGRSSSLTAPNGPAQQEVIRAALKAAGLSPYQVTGLSLHGTGTSLGDPIELGAAAEVFGSDGKGYKSATQHAACDPLVMLSSKSWLGHAEPAAGIVGMLHGQTLLSQAAALPISHLRSLNPMVGGIMEAAAAQGGLQRKPWFMPRQLAGRPSCVSVGEQAVVGTSAFAYQGTNAHVLLSKPLATSSIVSDAGTENAGFGHLPWAAQRLWVLPQLSSLMQMAWVKSSQLKSLAPEVVLVSKLAEPRLAFLWDHMVGGKVLLPGAAMLEAAAAAGRVLLSSAASAANTLGLSITGISIHAPLVLPDNLAAAAGSTLQVKVSLRDGSLQLASASGVSHHQQVHLSGRLAACSLPSSKEEKQGLLAIPVWLQQVISAAISQDKGEIKGQTGAAAAAGNLAAAVADAEAFVLHPAVLDNAFQLCAAVSEATQQGKLLVPASVDAIMIMSSAVTEGGCGSDLYATAQVTLNRVATSRTKSSSTHIRISPSAAADAICLLDNLVAKELTQLPAGERAGIHATAVAALAVVGDAATKQPQGASQMMYETTWAVAEPAVAATTATEQSCAAAVGMGLGWNRGDGVDGYAVFASALAAAQVGVNQGLLTGFNAHASTSSMAEMGMGGLGQAAIRGVLHGMLKAVGQEQGKWDVSYAADTGVTSAAQLQLSRGSAPSAGPQPANAFGSKVDSSLLLAPVLVPAAVSSMALPDYGLVPEPRGSFASLVPAAVDLSPGSLAAGHVGVRVQAVGLNFRDVLNVLGMYPGDPGAPGGDCAGLVVTSSASSLCPGQSVFGLAVGSLGSAVVCAADTLMVMPSSISYEEAASMPTVFITAHKALADVTAVQPGESVLVHAAAGGVGLAASQVLAGLGAVCVATGGSPSKRVLLRGLGVGAVVGSRDSSFVEPLAQLGGCDVLLNSLTSPGMVAASMALIKQGGRMAEIGKRDIWSAAAAAAERPDVSYNLLAVDFLPGEVVQTALQKVAAGVAAGMLRPLPTIAHELSSVVAAFRQMSQARHVGKITISPSPSLSYNPLTAAWSGSSGSVAVTGGLGALGILLTQWLISRGVMSIALLGRTATPSEQLLQLIAAEGQLAEVVVYEADASNRGDVEGVVAVLAEQKPLLAVLHAGGVLRDAMVSQQTAAAARQVFAPKTAALSAWISATSCQPVAQQALFSSVASLLGSPGQSNYAAANAGLDGAAGVLSAAGLGVVSCQWGAWAGAGMAAQDASTAARVARSGMELLQPQQGLAALEAILGMSAAAASVKPNHSAVVAVVPFVWERFLQRYKGNVPNFFSEVAASVAAANGQVQQKKAAVKAAVAAQRTDALKQQVEETIQSILGHEVSRKIMTMC